MEGINFYRILEIVIGGMAVTVFGGIALDYYREQPEKAKKKFYTVAILALAYLGLQGSANRNEKTAKLGDDLRLMNEPIPRPPKQEGQGDMLGRAPAAGTSDGIRHSVMKPPVYETRYSPDKKHSEMKLQDFHDLKDGRWQCKTCKKIGMFEDRGEGMKFFEQIEEPAPEAPEAESKQLPNYDPGFGDNETKHLPDFGFANF